MLKFALIILILLPDLYLASYVIYIWKTNRSASIGSAVIALLALALPIYVLFFK